MTDTLDAATVSHFRDALVALDTELRAALELSEDRARVVDLDDPIGRLSRIDAIQQQRMAQANKRRLKLRREMIKSALARIERDDGSFGFCLECDEPIGRKRLDARPEVTLCLECQSAAEGGPRRRRKRR